MAFIDGTALGVITPTLQTSLNATAEQIVWVTNAYNLMLAALILVGGKLGDLFGRNRIFRIGILIFTVASVACGLAPSAELLIAARVVQGLGGALMVPGSLSIIAATFSPEKRGQAIGTWSTFTTITTVLGPVLGGFLAQAGLWRGVFFINVPLAIVSLVALARVPETRDEKASHQIDYAGAVLITVGLAALTYGLTAAGSGGLGQPLVLISIVAGIVALIAFVFVERRSENPMLPLSMFKSRTFAGTNLLTLFLYGALYSVLFFLPLNLVQVQGYDQQTAGFANLPFSIMLILLSRRMGGLVDRIGARIPLTVGPVIAGIGFFLLGLPGLTNGPSDYFTTFFPGAVVLGLGMAITIAPLTTAMMNSAPRENSGAASGVNNAVSRVGGVLATAIFGAVAVALFTNALLTRTAEIPNITPETTEEIRLEAQNLAAFEPPESLPPEGVEVVESAVRETFTDVFRVVTIAGAVMAFISAGMAFLLVDPKETKSEGNPQSAAAAASGD